jgi:hypothetical protein
MAQPVISDLAQKTKFSMLEYIVEGLSIFAGTCQLPQENMDVNKKL